MDDRLWLEPLNRVLQQHSSFGHRQHVELAWVYLQSNDQATAEELMRCAIRHVASVHGTPDKFHETLTNTWTRLVACHVRRSNRPSFNEFIEHNGDLLNRNVPSHYFSDGALHGRVARIGRIDPDLAPLPT
jgi:hypothetical protein